MVNILKLHREKENSRLTAATTYRTRTSALALLLCVAAFGSTALAGTVTITSPVNGSMVNSPVHIHATYNGTVTATYMKLWVDHVASTIQKNTNVFDTSVSLANGTHLIEVQASDPSTGKIYTSAAQTTVAALAVNPVSSSLPPGGMQQFTATGGSSITWAATGGTISSGGLYTAGSTTGTFSVTASDSSGHKTTVKMIIAPANTVTIENPANGKTVSNPVFIHATYNSKVVATYMKLWVDHVAGVVQHNTNSFTTSAYMASGNHLIEVQALDSATGLFHISSVTVTVGGGSGGGTLNYTTWKNDNLRTGQQRSETFLTPANVNSTHFGVLFSNSVDGFVFAQPLYMSNVSIGGGTHNVVFVATEKDSVYAFDADVQNTLYWHKTLIPSGGTTVPQSLVGSTIYPVIGITGTPVIDPSAGTLYLVTETLENSNVVFRLHALNIVDGSERGGSPVLINTTGWQPKEQLQRPGLLLANGNVYIAFGSQGDNQPYHGWIFAYSASSLAKVAAWNATSTGKEGAIWMSGSAIAADSNGDLYVITSNGDFNGTTNFSDSFVKLSPNLSTVLDYFTPFNQSTLSANDQDVGSGGVLLVPNQTGNFPHEVIGCGKAPAVFVLNRDNMGKFQSGSNSQIIQEIDNQVGGTTGHQAPDRCFMTPAFWQQNVYFGGSNDVLKVFHLDPTTGKMTSTPTSKGSFLFVFPGTQPVVSSNGSSNGIVWALDYSSATTLHAYDATNLANEIYRSPSLGQGSKFAVPTVVNSKVFVGTASKLFVLGPM